MFNLSKVNAEDYVKVNYKDETLIEASLNLSPERENKILSVSGMTAGEKVTVENDVVNYSGKVFFNIVFEGEELERLETGVKFEFKKTEENAKHAVCLYELSDFKTRNENGALYVSCILTKNLTVFKADDKEVITGADCFVKNEEIALPDRIFGRQEYDLDDKFEIQKIKKVLQSKVVSVVERAVCSENVVTAEGFVNISFVFLPFSENSDILKETRSVPFKCEISLDGVKEDYRASVFSCVEDFSVKAYLNDDESRTIVETAVTLDFTVLAEGFKKYVAVTDAAAAECNLRIVKEETLFEETVSQRTVSQRIFGKCAVKIPEYSRFIKAVGENAYVTQYEITDGEITFTGAVEADCIFAGDNGIVSEKSILPFNITETVTTDKIENVSVNAENLQGRLRSGNLEQDVNLSVRFTEVKENKLLLVKNLEEGEVINAPRAPITVYIGKKGETEWDVIKALKEDASAIYEFNPDLTFPLSGDERIVILRKKK